MTPPGGQKYPESVYRPPAHIAGWDRVLVAGLSGSTQLLVVCPICFALVRERDGRGHLDSHSAITTIATSGQE